jgi:hypothetical protein
MILRRLHRVHEVFAVLSLPSAEIVEIRALIFPEGRLPARRTFERRLQRLTDDMPTYINRLGLYLLALYEPWAHSGRAVAIDSTSFTAHGSPWHQKDRREGQVPNTSTDTEAHWTHAGWHGWVYGYKLHLVSTVATVWIPLAARIRPANEADNVLAPELLAELPPDARYVLADSQYNTKDLRALCEAADRFLVASHRGRHPRTDDGKEVRKLLHRLRSIAIENFNSLFKAIFDGRRPLPIRGLLNTQRLLLGAVLVYQIALLYRFRCAEPHQVGIKALLRAA